MKTTEKMTIEKLASVIGSKLNLDSYNKAMKYKGGGLMDVADAERIAEESFNYLTIEEKITDGYTLTGIFLEEEFIGATVIEKRSIVWETTDIEEYEGTKNNF